MPDYALCDGKGDATGDHCCYVAGEPCQYLQINGPSGRKYACGLFLELGSWAAVHSDPRYLANVKPAWDRRGTADCGPWMGATREQMVTITTRGSITTQEFTSYAQCCFRRVWCATPQRIDQAVRAINRAL